MLAVIQRVTSAKVVVDGVEFKEAFLPASYLQGKAEVHVEITLGSK